MRQQLYPLLLTFIFASCMDMSTDLDFQEVGSNGIGGRSVAGSYQGSLSAFEQTLFPVVTTNCKQCHGKIQNPKFAVLEKPSDSHDIIISQDLVNLSNPKKSYMLQKIDGGHQGFSSSLAQELEEAIEQWAQLSAVTPKAKIKNVDVVIQATSAQTVLSKVKAMTHGGFPSSSELASVKSANGDVDAAKLNAIIDEWMNSKEFEYKLQHFLSITLQQNLLEAINDTQAKDEYEDVFGSIRGNRNNNRRFVENLSDSFVRTSLDIVKRGESFKQVTSTNRVQVTTAILAAIAFQEDPDTYNDKNKLDFRAARDEFSRSFEGDSKNNVPKRFTENDFRDWRYVTFNHTGNKNTSLKWRSVGSLRKIAGDSVIEVGVPRNGFFMTPAFRTIHKSNRTNQFRRTMNQTLLVALNKAFEAGDQTHQPNLQGVDEEHTAKDSACFQCHRLMDPMKEVFKWDTNFENFYSPAKDQEPASFAFRGYIEELTKPADMAVALGEHDRFALGWAEKVCNYLGSQACSVGSAEVNALAQTFKNSNYNFLTLYKTALLANLNTGVGTTDAFETGSFKISASRKNHLCHSLNIRQRNLQRALKETVSSLDGGDYICDRLETVMGALGEDVALRGMEGISNSSPVDLIFMASSEGICSELINNRHNIFEFIDDKRDRPVDPTIEAILEHVAGIGKEHSEYAVFKQAAKQLYERTGKEFGLRAVEGFNQVFMLACSAPHSLAIGF